MKSNIYLKRLGSQCENSESPFFRTATGILPRQDGPLSELRDYKNISYLKQLQLSSKEESKLKAT